MELLLDRKYKKSGYTIGNLYVDGVWYCNTLEDTDRGLSSDMELASIKAIKVPGKTAIPTGRYEVVLNVVSHKYAKKKAFESIKGKMPRLKAVPGFSGILIHTGNSPSDTEGCLLVGYNEVKGMVVNSTTCFWKLYNKLKEAEGKIWITIK